MLEYFDIVFDKPPSPSGSTFVEVETDKGRSFNLGEWLERPDGYWVIRVRPHDVAGIFGSAELLASLQVLADAHELTIAGEGYDPDHCDCPVLNRARAAIAAVTKPRTSPTTTETL
jgi:hypothetical protein